MPNGYITTLVGRAKEHVQLYSNVYLNLWSLQNINW